MDAKGQHAKNRMKASLAAGSCCVGMTITINSPVVAELVSRLGLDWLWFEMEHTPLSVEAVQTMLQATNGAAVSTVVRVPWNDKTRIKRVLDTGPDGILVPLVNSRPEAEEAVRAIKYPPVGERGAGLARAQCYGLQMENYLKTANAEVLTMLMIEHAAGVERIEEILGVPGVDSIMVGALDISGSMGLLGQTGHPAVEAMVQKVLGACRRAGVPCGIVALDPEAANRRIREGFQIIVLAIDVLILIGGVKAALGQLTLPGRRGSGG